MGQLKSKMTISEISRLSGIPQSTIKYYIGKKLLPKPLEEKRKRAVYTLKHLDRLNLIKKIKKVEKISLDKVGEILKQVDLGEKRKQREGVLADSKVKDEIIESTVPLFREKGYESVTIADIIDAAGIGRSTLYKFFKNKKELFIECINKTLFSETLEDFSSDTLNSKNHLTEFDAVARKYYKKYPLWRDMLTMLRAAAITDPEEFEELLEKAIKWKRTIFENQIEEMIQKGLIRKLNKDVLAIFFLGLYDVYSDYLYKENLDENTISRVFEEVKDVVLHGITKKN